jgi:hypothetical protein
VRPFVPQPLPRDDLDWGELVRLIVRANRAIARYDGIVQGLVNPSVLLSPLAAREEQLAIRALDILFDHPIFSTPQFVARSGVPKGSAVRILSALVDGGILRVIRPGLKRRPAIYAFSDLIEIVNAPQGEAPPRLEPTVRTLDVANHA